MVFCPLRSLPFLSSCNISLPHKTGHRSYGTVFSTLQSSCRGQESCTQQRNLQQLGLVSSAGQEESRRQNQFHHEISTERAAVSLLFSREVSSQQMSFCKHKSFIMHEETATGRRCIRLDPGKRNIATLVDKNGGTPLGKSGFSRYKKVLGKQKEWKSWRQNCRSTPTRLQVKRLTLQQNESATRRPVSFKMLPSGGDGNSGNFSTEREVNIYF